MKVIRATERHLWVPVNPEAPSANQKVKLVEVGSVALVPKDFNEGKFKVVKMGGKARNKE